MDKRTTEDRQEPWPQEVRPAPPKARGPQRMLGIGLALMLVAATGWWIYQRPATRAPASRSASAPPASVGAAAVQTGAINITLSGLGTVTSLSTVTIRTQISGYLSRVAFEEGQT